jgi:hypothetical protein
LIENHIESYPNPSYSPSSCDFFLFPKLKNRLCGIQFDEDNMMFNALEQVIDDLTKEHFQNCFKDRFIRMQKCIDVEGQHFGKIH